MTYKLILNGTEQLLSDNLDESIKFAQICLKTAYNESNQFQSGTITKDNQPIYRIIAQKGEIITTKIAE